MPYINRGVETTETKMERLAAEMLKAEDGKRVFFRSDPTLNFTLSQVVTYLRAKSRGGDLQAASDLAEIESVSSDLKQLKTKFYETPDIGEKKDLARKYKAREDDLKALLSKGGD